MPDKLELILNQDELSSAAKQLLSFAGERKVFLFNAEMGAGKTTFIKALCKELGVNDNMSSPTYSIVNEYVNTEGEKIFHFDLYRLRSIDECFDIGFEEYLESDHYCFIEWPDIAKPLYPPDSVDVVITVTNNIRYLCAL